MMWTPRLKFFLKTKENDILNLQKVLIGFNKLQ